ncbi:ABC transporter substrate-binding protein [Chelatococcus asaccharovorans]|uniref:Amino acid/amide ABC transporter substrate-binding protein (HAAT family) n=1 Tax=Chelatococcus asaccharovorans TaxID=28210 RepID=A0A2V3UI63_9HYPH|nr:ABC transporter substrate-binding protein [Chelatococcus asaccharovorans]MBS7706627.1 ABC transporter substrate-binding protein [Chelatococcus asaccharovorans]PXW64723.1 amino acid/amide ABC transporter substrate-binding protein (HAAT family) [Chelatococcus asaccharovorans]
MISRRQLVAGAGAVLALPSARAIAQAGPIRIGMLTVKSGALAAGGRQMEDGFRLFLSERANRIAGREVAFMVADTGGQPALAKTRAQELVQRAGVHVVVGPVAAFEALAINDYLQEAGVPFLCASAAAEDLTQRRINPWFVRTSSTSAQPCHPLGEYVARDLGYKRVVTIADDFAFGQEQTAGFQRAFVASGGTVVRKLWSPLNVADYGSYIAQIGEPDAVFAAFAGANGLRFLRQYAEYGLKQKIPIIGAMTTVDEGVLHSMGDEALGIVSAGWYSAALPGDANRRFVTELRKETGVDPGFYSAGAYSAGLALENALQNIDGKVEDKQAFMAALRKVEIADDPRGPWRLDSYGNPIQNIYIRKTERKGGRLVNTVVKTYENVSQFWTYNAEAFLSAPVYSRNDPTKL